MRKPIRSVRFTEDAVRDAEVRDPNPSLNNTCPDECHQRNPNDPKFEKWSQVETEWHERWAREAARKLAKKITKLEESKKATFFSPTQNGVTLHNPKLSRKPNNLWWSLVRICTNRTQ